MAKGEPTIRATAPGLQQATITNQQSAIGDQQSAFSNQPAPPTSLANPPSPDYHFEIPMLEKLADTSNPTSLSSRARKKRFDFFLNLLNQIPEPFEILDVGGSQAFWKSMQWIPSENRKVTLLNLKAELVTIPYFTSVAGDARTLAQFADQQFDVVFSNSVIEHVGTLREQIQMAEAVQRVGKRYFIQTPNRHFPIEPHFLIPFFQYAPQWFRARCLQFRKLGWVSREPDFLKALAETESIRLLNKMELSGLFPDCRIYEEKFVAMTKSLTAFKNF